MMVHSNANTQEVPLEMYSHGPSFLHSIAQALQAFATVSCGMFTWQSRWSGKANEGQFERNDKTPCFDHLWSSFLQSCHAVMPQFSPGKKTTGWHSWHDEDKKPSPGHLLFLLGVWSRKYPFRALLLSHGSCLPKLGQLKGPGIRWWPQNLWWYGLHINETYIGEPCPFFFQMVYFIGWEIMDRIELIRLFNLFILRVLLNWSALRSSEGWTCCGILHQGQSMGHWEWLISKSGSFVFANFVQEMPPMRPYYHYTW